MLDIVRKILSLLERRERREFYALFGMILVMGIFEVVGVASIMPFMAVVTNPDVVFTNQWLHRAYTGLEFESTNRFLFALGLLVLALLLLSNGFALTTLWCQSRFVELRGATLARRLLVKYISEPYIFFLNRNTSELVKNVLNEIRIVVGAVLMPLVRLVSGSFVALMIFGLLVFIDPGLALTVAVVLGTIYTTIYAFVRKRLARSGEGQLDANNNMFRVVTESFGGIKDMKVLGRERHFIDTYARHANAGAHHAIASHVISMMPKYSLEVVAFGGILLIILYLLQVRQNIDQVIPLISLYAFAGYRLMPAVQTIYGSLSYVRHYSPSLNLIFNDYQGYDLRREALIMEPSPGEKIALRDRLELRGLQFSYPNTEKPVLDGLDLSIRARTTVGFVGKTGCGKTTAIDIVMGLLHPQSGEFLVDGIPIGPENVRAWQSDIGYVPQSIFLLDDSITRNIAFGVPEDQIDRDAVRRAAEIANLHDFIRNDLPNGYDTVVGERGVRLSGGQRQRVGIARALYHDPDILILDEATSSLDPQTEEAVTRAIHNIAGKKTIILIAHRLTTVRECDVIYFMERGRILHQGTFNELISSSREFQALAAAASQ